MLEKCRIIYKGDIMAAGFYLVVGIILFCFAFVLYSYAVSAGFKFLSYGFFMFFLYSIGKGLGMYIIYSKKYRFYTNINTIDTQTHQAEIKYTEYRIYKKNINRRRYIWTLIISCFIAFLGIFSSQKSILMGTSIPIALISGIELSIGMLTEFRLREFLRILKK